MKTKTFLLPIAASALLLGVSPAAKAVVNPADPFTFDIIGFNLNPSTGQATAAAYLATGSATFGIPATATDSNTGATVTLASSEAVGATSTTDTFTISTATTFISTPDLGSGASSFLVNGLQFDLGDANSGNEAVNVVLPITTYSSSGTTTYGATTSSITVPVTPNTTVATDGSNYVNAEGVNTSNGTSAPAIDTYGVHSFTFSITYATLPIPEPSTWAMLGFGATAFAAFALRSRRAKS